MLKKLIEKNKVILIIVVLAIFILSIFLLFGGISGCKKTAQLRVEPLKVSASDLMCNGDAYYRFEHKSLNITLPGITLPINSEEKACKFASEVWKQCGKELTCSDALRTGKTWDVAFTCESSINATCRGFLRFSAETGNIFGEYWER